MLIYFSNIFTNMWKILHAAQTATLRIILEMPSCSFLIMKFLCDLLLLLSLLFCWNILKYMRQDKVFPYDRSRNSFMEIIFRMKLNSTQVFSSRYSLFLVHSQSLALQCFSTRLSKV